MDSAVHRINHYPGDKRYQNQLSYPMDSDLSGGQRYLSFEQLGPGGERAYTPGPSCSKPD